MNARPDPSIEAEVVPHSVRRRREAATRRRGRQLLVIDLAVAFALALAFIALAPGLAIVAIGSLLVLVGCAASLAYGRLRAPLRARRAGRRARG